MAPRALWASAAALAALLAGAVAVPAEVEAECDGSQDEACLLQFQGSASKTAKALEVAASNTTDHCNYATQQLCTSKNEQLRICIEKGCSCCQGNQVAIGSPAGEQCCNSHDGNVVTSIPAGFICCKAYDGKSVMGCAPSSQCAVDGFGRTVAACVPADKVLCSTATQKECTSKNNVDRICIEKGCSCCKGKQVAIGSPPGEKCCTSKNENAVLSIPGNYICCQSHDGLTAIGCGPGSHCAVDAQGRTLAACVANTPKPVPGPTGICGTQTQKQCNSLNNVDKICIESGCSCCRGNQVAIGSPQGETCCISHNRDAVISIPSTWTCCQSYDGLTTIGCGPGSKCARDSVGRTVAACVAK